MDTCRDCRNPDYYDNDHGIRSGTTGVVTHVSTFHGLLTVRFERHGELTAIKLHQVAHA
jgi:hypothetical protein